MADISVEKKNGTDFTWVWAAAAIVAVVGLMAWLMSTRDATMAAAAARAAADSAVEAEPTAEVVELSAISGSAGDYLGRQVRVEGVTVAAVLGTRGFWADVPGANPVLVVLGPAVADASWIEPGASRDVVASVEATTPEEVNTWVQSGVLHPDAAAQASFATHYLYVSEVSASE